MDYRRFAVFFGIILIVFLIALQLTRSCGYTAPIEKNGTNSIAVLKSIRIGGVDQWILIRGNHINNPILLYLAGGPGLSELAWLRTYNSGLEDHFIVVNWDQRGAGKSYQAFQSDTNVTVQSYVSDTVELVHYLLNKFDRKKIFLAGHGFGSVIGIYAAKNLPDRIYAYIGISQMVNPKQNDILSYREAWNTAVRLNNTNAIRQLKEIGAPPYHGSNAIEQIAQLNGWINQFSINQYEKNDYITNWIKAVLKAPEYSLSDRRHFWKGFFTVFGKLYPEMNEIDLTREVTELKMPVYFIGGKFDRSSYPEISENYLRRLKAPYKEFILFKKSGNSPNFEEPEYFDRLFSDKILREASASQ